MQLYVEGKIKTDTWQDEQGNNRKKVRIRVLSFTMLGGRPEGGSTSPEQQPSGNYANKPVMNSPNPPVIENTSTDDDLPF